jgi:uncharacterized surface protein with fasciclin (FAS1) repeats
MVARRATTGILAAVALLAACNDQGGSGNGAALSNSAAAGETPQAAAKGTILDSLDKSNDHRSFVNAVKAAGLTETLSGSQPYTVFAPTDAAFEKLAPGAANGLLEPEAKSRLVGLLTGHIVPGVVTAADLGRAIDRGKGKAQLATMGGGTLSFTKDGDAIMVADAKGARGRIAGSGQLQSNGVVHSVDTVMAAR